MTSEQSPPGGGPTGRQTDGQRADGRQTDGQRPDGRQSPDQSTGGVSTDGAPPKTVQILYVDPEGPPSALSAGDDVSISSVATVEAARDKLAVGAGDLDCIVSEYELPDGDGIEILETVQTNHLNLPVVLFTGSGSEAVATEAFRKGATDYLPKDADEDSLRKRVKSAVSATNVETDSGISGDRMRELTNAFPDVAFILDENGRYLEILSGTATENLRTIEHAQLIGERLHDTFEKSKADRFIDHIQTTLDAGGVETIEYRVETTNGNRWYEGRTAPLGDTIDGREAVVWVARDITDRRESERKLTQRRDELARLTRINGLINSILKSLVGSATREEIERIVCKELANSEFYQFAWIGGSWIKEEQMSPSVVEGVEREMIERLLEATTKRSSNANSLARVIGEGESVVVSDVAESEILSERERELMFEMEMSSAVLVPLTYGNTSFGILGISGGCTGTFSDRELAALETLCEIVAFAIEAVKNRNLLLSDTAVELEFRVENEKSGFAHLTKELDCRVSLEGVVPMADDRLLEYISVEGAPPDTITDHLADQGIVDEYRLVTEDDDECLLEMELSWSGVNQLLKAGTVVKSVRAEDGEVRYVAEASPDVNVRSVVDSFRTTYPDAELVSKQEVNRSVHTIQEFQQTLGEDLTDKQKTALQAAFFAGYYEYPRESTGKEVADSLDVSSPTLHQHLQAAQQKLVSTFLDQ